MKGLSSYSARKNDIIKKWLLIDCKGEVLGRIAAQIAKILRGKHKANYTPNMDCGDNIIAINASEVKLTGKKLHNKIYYKHTGYPGGLKERTAMDILQSKRPTDLLMLAVSRMMPKESPLSRKQLKNLYIYSDANHTHQSQKPESTKITK